MRAFAAFLLTTSIATAASAQTGRTPQPLAPWAETRPTVRDEAPPTDAVSDAEHTLPPAPVARHWPTIRPPTPRPAVEYAWTPGTSLATGPRLRETPDLGAVGYFQTPSARLLRLGDVLAQYVSALGWAGVRYGLSRRIDVGVGIPFYLYGISLDARVGFIQRDGFAASWWGYVTVPFRNDADRPTDCLGFTWNYAAVGWASGPLLTWWKGRWAVNAGVHLAQRTGLGGVWLLSHATLDFRVVDGVKLLAQVLSLYELSLESRERAGSLLGNGTPRFLPYALGGARFYTRRFFADLGLLAPLSSDAPLYSDRLPVLPWVSLSHLF